MYKKVLIPVSGENHCKRATVSLKKALDLCDGLIIILHVCEAIPQTVGGENRIELKQEQDAQGMVMLSPMIEQLEHLGRHFRTVVKSGPIAETIVGVADEEEADLIVMFTDGRDNIGDYLLGTITEHVLRNTGVDLLAVRG